MSFVATHTTHGLDGLDVLGLVWNGLALVEFGQVWGSTSCCCCLVLQGLVLSTLSLQ